MLYKPIPSEESNLVRENKRGHNTYECNLLGNSLQPCWTSVINKRGDLGVDISISVAKRAKINNPCIVAIRNKIKE